MQVFLHPLSNTVLSIKTSCLLVCLLTPGLSPLRIHPTHSGMFHYSEWCKTRTSNILFSHIPLNKTHFWFSLVWSWHCISIIFSLNINHGCVWDAFHRLLLKYSNGLLVGIGRLWCLNRADRGSRRNVFPKICWKFTFSRPLFLSLSLPLLYSAMTAV